MIENADSLEQVALLAEGVDRNGPNKRKLRKLRVALLAEGVDRNDVGEVAGQDVAMSPSSRRAWIEMSKRRWSRARACVALLAEGVDRNSR